MDRIIIKEDCKVIEARNAMLSGSYFNDVAMANVTIVNANLSDLEIEGAQIGGAYIHNIGGPPPGHPMYDPAFKHKPVRFEDCDLNSSTFTNCDLSGVSFSDCKLSGATINGIAVEELLLAYASLNP
ncbi:MAG TPA: pentapeptide repeat-containing protein [Mucilaginibacter sp.]|nr:pentapeptide repeat-containing protein [Mucilaginibacter sp.]